MDTPIQVLHGTAVISTLDGVTTVLVAFLFVCLVIPTLVKHRPQYYAALFMIVAILLLHTISLAVNHSDTLVIAIAVFTGLLQIVTLITLFLCVGGLTVRQFTGDLSRAYEVMRRGETTKEVIIPIGDQGPRSGV